MRDNEGNLGEGECIRRMKENDRIEKKQNLTTEEMEVLVKDVLTFSDTIKNILFFYYVFHHSIEEIEEILEIPAVEDTLSTVTDWLAKKIGKEQLDFESMYRISEKVMKTEMDMLNDLILETQDQVPKYSAKFQKRMAKILPESEKIEPATKRGQLWRNIIRKAATFACMIGIMLGIQSGETGGKHTEWIWQHFLNRDSFWTQGEENAEKRLDAQKIKINYIPKELDYVVIKKREKGILYWYYSSNKLSYLRIQISKYGGKEKIIYDTETAELKEIFIKKHQAFFWEKEGKNRLLWQRDGIIFSMDGTVEPEEIIKVAKSILI